FSGSGSSNTQGAGNISFDKFANGQSLPTLSLAVTSAGPISLGGTIQTFNVVDNIQVHATNASATLSSATDSFTMGTMTSVPAPTALLLVGSGLVGLNALGFFRRRAAR